MGYNQKFVKIERVIEKVRRDLPGGYELSMTDVIEWVGEAISMIGAYSAFVTKETDGDKSKGNPQPVIVSNYRATLPCDLYKLNAINIINDYDEDNSMVLNQEAASASSAIFYNKSIEPLEYSSNSYTVRNGYIYMDNMDEGLLSLSYEAFAVDDRGFPLIPDDDRYVAGLASYVMERVAFKMMMMDYITERKYDRIQQQWMFDVNKAYTGSLLMNIDDAESFRNSFTRMVADSSARASSYSLENKRQELKTHTN